MAVRAAARQTMQVQVMSQAPAGLLSGPAFFDEDGNTAEILDAKEKLCENKL